MKLSKEQILILKKGGVGIIPTDTLYGMVGSALIPGVVEKIYELRHRDLNKPMIILISSIEDLRFFNVKLNREDNNILNDIWPGKVSIVFECGLEKFHYLHRGKKSLAFRLPGDEYLRRILRETGPLVAPSANTEGKAPAKTIKEAKEYFGDNVQFYVEGGNLQSQPSTIIQIHKGNIKILREGVVDIKI